MGDMIGFLTPVVSMMMMMYSVYIMLVYMPKYVLQTKIAPTEVQAHPFTWQGK